MIIKNQKYFFNLLNYSIILKYFNTLYLFTIITKKKIKRSMNKFNSTAFFIFGILPSDDHLIVTDVLMKQTCSG